VVDTLSQGTSRIDVDLLADVGGGASTSPPQSRCNLVTVGSRTAGPRLLARLAHPLYGEPAGGPRPGEMYLSKVRG